MLAELFARSVTYVATDSATGASETFVVDGGLSPDWSYGSYHGIMSIPGVHRAVLLLSDLLGQLPWHAYRQLPGQPVQMLDPQPPLLTQPSAPDTRMTTMSSMAMDLIQHGNAVALIAARDIDGWPTQILPIPAENVGVRRVTQPEGFMGVPRGEIVYYLGSEQFRAGDIIHVKGPARPGGLRGFGVLENHLRRTLALAAEQAKQAGAVGDMGVPTGTLKSTDPDFDEDDARRLKASWVRNQRERTVAILNATTEYQALAWNPTETQLLEARKFSLHEIALIYGLSPTWLGVAGPSLTYSNLESEWLNLVRASVGGHLARFEQTLTAHMPPGNWAKANLDALVRGDTQARYTAHEIGIRSGFLTKDEARDLEDLPPLTPEQLAAQAPPALPQAGAAGPVFAVGDRVRITVAPHAPGQKAGTVALVEGNAYGIKFDSMPNMIHKWYLGSELQKAPGPAPTAGGG